MDVSIGISPLLSQNIAGLEAKYRRFGGKYRVSDLKIADIPHRR